jgi:hypothetical protein
MMKTEYVQQWLKDTAEYFSVPVWAEIDEDYVYLGSPYEEFGGKGDGSDWEEAAFNFVTNKGTD